MVTAEDGLRAAEMAGETVDLYLLDVDMPGQSGILAAALALVSVGALVWERLKKNEEKAFLYARIAAAAALVIGAANALLV